MRTLGLNPVEVLVLPRVFAPMLNLPVLTFFADLMGLAGGALMAWSNLGIDPFLFFRRPHDTVSLTTFLPGIIKAPVFASLIALVRSYEGLLVKLDDRQSPGLNSRNKCSSSMPSYA